MEITDIWFDFWIIIIIIIDYWTTWLDGLDWWDDNVFRIWGKLKDVLIKVWVKDIVRWLCYV